jgi:CubicO group peptidase (beta-lactamase class C family)
MYTKPKQTFQIALSLAVFLFSQLSLGAVSKGSLAKLTRSLQSHPEWNVHSLLITFHDSPIYEQYFSGQDQRWGESLGLVKFKQDTLHDLRSVTKSIVSMLIGIARDERYIKSIDQPIMEFFPEQKTSEKWKKVTIKHLLTMTSGLDWIEDVPYNDPSNDEAKFIESGGSLSYIFGKAFSHEPGSHFLYAGGATEILAEIVTRATGQKVETYFEQKILIPLGIEKKNYTWAKQKNGSPSGASGLRMRPIDLHKIATLVLNQGMYQGKKVLNSSWVTESTHPHVSISSNQGIGALYRAYGYQWWIPRFSETSGPRAFAASGNGGQLVLIIPEHKLVIQLMCGRYNDFSPVNSKLLNQEILPALGLHF